VDYNGEHISDDATKFQDDQPRELGDLALQQKEKEIKKQQ